jgi:glutathione transport system substrate-binding protein
MTEPRLNAIDKTELVDANIVKIMLKAPFSSLAKKLAHPAAVIISPAGMAQVLQGYRFPPGRYL